MVTTVTLAAVTVISYAGAAILYRKMRNADIPVRMTRFTAILLAAWGTFQLVAITSNVLAAQGILAGRALTAYVGAMHVFAFLSIAYMWRATVTFLFSDWEWFWKVILGYGLLFFVTGGLTLAGVIPPMVVNLQVILGMVPVGLALGAIGYYSAYQLGGDDAVKVGLFTTGVVVTLVITSMLVNLDQAGVITAPPYSIVTAHIVFALLFLASVYWGEIRGLKW